MEGKNEKPESPDDREGAEKEALEVGETVEEEVDGGFIDDTRRKTKNDYWAAFGGIAGR